MRRSRLLCSVDPWQVLGVQKGADKKLVKEAYLKLAKQYHPDMNKGNDDRFREVKSAYEQIRTGKAGAGTSTAAARPASGARPDGGRRAPEPPPPPEHDWSGRSAYGNNPNWKEDSRHVNMMHRAQRQWSRQVIWDRDDKWGKTHDAKVVHELDELVRMIYWFAAFCVLIPLIWRFTYGWGGNKEEERRKEMARQELRRRQLELARYEKSAPLKPMPSVVASDEEVGVSRAESEGALGQKFSGATAEGQWVWKAGKWHWETKSPDIPIHPPGMPASRQEQPPRPLPAEPAALPRLAEDRAGEGILRSRPAAARGPAAVRDPEPSPQLAAALAVADAGGAPAPASAARGFVPGSAAEPTRTTPLGGGWMPRRPKPAAPPPDDDTIRTDAFQSGPVPYAESHAPWIRDRAASARDFRQEAAAPDLTAQWMPSFGAR